jgi:hypothetical protein
MLVDIRCHVPHQVYGRWHRADAIDARQKDSTGLAGSLHLQSRQHQALAGKIHVPVDALAKTIANMNEYAKTGVDVEFARGINIYDQMFSDANVKPNLARSLQRLTMPW